MTSFDGLDSDQLKERLGVAETLMKKLYNRNKVLEEYHTGKMSTKKKGEEKRCTVKMNSTTRKNSSKNEREESPLFTEKKEPNSKTIN